MINISSSETFDFRSDEYLHLFLSSKVSAFQHPIWLENFYTHMLASNSAKAQIVEFRGNENELLGVVPLILRRKSGLKLLETTDLGVSDYSAPILSPDLISQLAVDQTLAKRFRQSLSGYDIFRVRPVREEHSEIWNLLIPSTERPLNFQAFATELGGSYADWHANKLDRSLGKQLQRKQRKIQREFSGELKLLLNEEEIRVAIAQIAHLRNGRFKEDVIQGQFALDHYTNVAISGAQSGYAMTYALHSNDGVIGYVFGVTHEGSFCYLLIGCDYEKWGKFSPGLLAYTWIIEDWIDRGGQQFDFTIGGEDFKHQFGTQATQMNAHVASGSALGTLVSKALPRKVMGEGA